MKQFNEVNCQYSAPMGRPSHHKKPAGRQIRLPCDICGGVLHGNRHKVTAIRRVER
jgi:hypothetical protein